MFTNFSRDRFGGKSEVLTVPVIHGNFSKQKDGKRSGNSEKIIIFAPVKLFINN